MKKWKVWLSILCAAALTVSVLGTLAVSGGTQIWREEANLVEQILERDGHINGIWYPWFQHKFLGHNLTGNELFAEKCESDTWMQVGIDQYGETNIYREIYNLKALGFNILGLEGSPLGEGVIYDPYGNVLGVKQDYLQNIRRLLNICREVGIPVLWTMTMHSTIASEYWENGKYGWDILSQAYANPEVADQYAEKFVKPVCAVLNEYPDVVGMITVGVELENEINDSRIGNYFEGIRAMYGVNQEPMLYFIKQVHDTIAQESPHISRTIASTSYDFTIYEDIDFDFIGRNWYTKAGTGPSLESHRAPAPMIATEFGLGDGVMVPDETWTIKQIQFRESFIEEGYAGWMMWCWNNTGFGTAYDLLDATGTSTTDFRAGAYTIKYFADNMVADHQGKEIVLDKPVLFCNTGSGKVEWISSRQATALDLLRSTDGGRTWKKLLDKVSPYDYEEMFKGTYIDQEMAEHPQDGTTSMYKMVAYDDEGNKVNSVVGNEAIVVGPPINILEQQDRTYSFEDGLGEWIEFGANGTYEQGANYSAKVIEVADAPHGNKALEFKLNHTTDANGNIVNANEWHGIHLDTIQVKPNTQYKLVVHYKIAPDAAFEYEESDNTHKMSGYLFARGLGENGEGSANGDINGKELASIYLLHGSKNEWRTNDATFRTNDSGLLCLDLRAVQFAGTPVHYYIDYIQIYEVL